MYLPCVLSKELLENAYHQSKRKAAERESGVQDVGDRWRETRGLWKEIPGEQLCIGHRGGQFRSGSVTQDAHHQLTYCWCSVNLTWGLTTWGAWSGFFSVFGCLAHVLMKLFVLLAGQTEVFSLPNPKNPSEFRNRKYREPTPQPNFWWMSSICMSPRSSVLPHVPTVVISAGFLLLIYDGAYWLPRKGSSQLSGTMARRCI